MARRAALVFVSPLLLSACGGAAGTTGEPATTGGASTGGGVTTTGDASSGAPTTGGATSSGGEGSAGEGASSGGDASSGGASSSGAPPAAFVLDCRAELTPEPRLALACNLPRLLADCAALTEVGAPCEDVDGDGLTDAWEDLALGRLRPLRRLDEDESLVDDAAAVLGDVGRVAPAGERARLFVMLGYSRDYGSCGGFTGHHGDSERVALDLLPDMSRGPGGVVVVGAYTAAHEGTSNDHGAVYTGDALAQLVFAADARTSEPRWVVFPSADKHATYATKAICEDVSPIPCFDEDCGPDGVDDPGAYERLPPIVNAGEEAAPRVTALDAIGFPGEQAWAEQDFCGGLGGDGCSSPVREKLLVDPF